MNVMEPSLRWRQVKINSDGGKFNTQIEKKGHVDR